MGSYLQTGDSLADWLGVLSQGALLVQELAVPAVGGGLEQTVVQDVLQALAQRAQDALLGRPHRGVWVETHAFLTERENRQRPISRVQPGNISPSHPYHTFNFSFHSACKYCEKKFYSKVI